MEKTITNMKEIIEDFIKEIENDSKWLIPENKDYDVANDYKHKIYNEISLQHELGKFLEKKDNFNVFYEKNMYNSKKTDGEDWVKKEADIVIIDKNFNKYAIELKFAQSKNGHFPEEMYQFVRDIRFMEQVLEKKEGYTATYNLIIVNDDKYFSSTRSNKDKYYKIFRQEDIIIHENLDDEPYTRPTGKKSNKLTSEEKIPSFYLARTYKEKWKKFSINDEDYKNYRYLLICHEHE